MKTKNKNLLLVILLIAVVGMAIGYAALSQQLVINGTANITTEWDVHIKNITASAGNATTGAQDKTQPSFTATSATFDVDLAYPGAYSRKWWNYSSKITRSYWSRYSKCSRTNRNNIYNRCTGK